MNQYVLFDVDEHLQSIHEMLITAADDANKHIIFELMTPCAVRATKSDSD